jgi:subtilisin family serine protease
MSRPLLCHFVTLALFLGAISISGKPIKLRNQTIDPANQALAQQRAEGGKQNGLFLIQLTGPVQQDWREELIRLGVEPLRHVPEDSFIVRLKNVPHGQVRRLPFVQWLGAYRPEHKVHRPLQQAGESPSVSLLLAPGSTADEIAQAKQSFRKVRESKHRFGHVLRGQLAPGQLGALAGSDAVLWIEAAPVMKLFDEVSSDIVAGPGGTHTTTIQDLGYDGADVTVAVADSGLHTGNVPGMHPDLAGRVDAFFYYGDLLDASDEHSHGTHVTGIIAGNGVIGETDEVGNLYGLGVAPGARIVAQRIFDGLGGYQPPGSFEELTRDALSAGADVGSNSWGDDTQGRYDMSAAEFDALVRDADGVTAGDQPYILEFSAGNAGPGPQTIGSPAVAKNVIATGAAQNNRFDFFIYADGQEAMADFSSRGPCEDGRIKPDIVAPGTWIASLRSAFADDENAWAPISPNYLYQGGTSQSGPHVSGAAAVFVHYYRENFGGTPSPALVKAALLNSAVDMDDEVETAPVPNNDEGWGRLDLTELIASPRTYSFLDQSVLLTSGQVYERRTVIGSPDEPLKVTLTYTDVPGFPGAIPALVNDLDLEVIAPDGRIYRGNQFNEGESIPNSAGRDAVNNVEGVHIFEPEPGEYLIRVRARNVPEDARVDTAAIDQDFALVVSAEVLPPGIGAIFLDRPAYTVPGRIKITVVDTDLAGTPSITVNIRSTIEAAGENVVLQASGTGGVFTNSISTTTSAVNGQLQIAHGNTITATYQDFSAGATRTANALADLLGPVISNISVTNRFGRPVIRWTTDELADARVLFGTNASLGQIASDSSFAFDHEISLSGLVPGRTYFYRVASTDRAGNASTNSTLGSFVAPAGRTVLLVDAFHDDLFFDPPPPIANYTSALDAIGVDYEVWDTSIDDSPTLSDLQPFRTVIWRLPELKFPNGTFSVGERSAISNYLNGGGSLFVASMEVLSRLDEAEPPRSFFAQNILQVPAYETDATVPTADGIDGDPITDGMSFELDYATEYGEFDFSDTITPGTNAAPIFLDAFGSFAGLRYPRPGVESLGRVVFLPFPFDAIPAGGTAPNTRTELLRRILNFLAPGLGGSGAVTLDKGYYTLPSIVTLEVSDSDLVGSGQLTVTASNSRTGNSIPVLAAETPRLGTFRGSFTLASAAGSGDLVGADGDEILLTYFDASRGQNVTAAATVDTMPAEITSVAHEADYVDAFISWGTSERTDALVQYGESQLLGRSAYVFELDFFHEVRLLGLQADQTYYYRVVSRDEAGNTVIDDNGGNLYTFRTLRPVIPPWTDNLDAGATNWTVIDGEDTFSTWTLGVPNNGWEEAANSPPNAWGSNLDGGVLDQAETFLVSPAIHLTGGNRATLRFWHSYDFTEKSEFDIIELGRVLIITNTLTEPVELLSLIDEASGWIEEEIDLTPYVGNLVYIAFHYVILSFDSFPRAGWLIDDVAVTMNTVAPGLVSVTNNLFQARFAISGQMSRTAAGKNYQITNAPPGAYNIAYTSVPFYTTPTAQSATLNSGATVSFVGNYTFTDANANGMSDAWETNHFGSVSPSRTATTDTDGDGMTDLQEFRAGTNPTSTASRFVIAPPVLLPDGQLRLQWAALQGRGYRVEGSTNGYHWSPVTPWLVAPGTLLTHDVPAWTPGAPYLFRVEVQP